VKVPLALVRFLLEAAFLVLVAAAAGLAGLDTLWIAVAMFGAWLLVALVERSGSSRTRRRGEPEAAVEAVVEPDPEPETELQTESEPEPEVDLEAKPEAEPVLVAVLEPPSEPDPEPEPEPAAVVVPLPLRDQAPRAWNLWELESLADTMNGDELLAEERTMLLLHLREYADPAGNLPPEFDPLVRDAFGAGLAELVT
jgi:hypothetical protein